MTISNRLMLNRNPARRDILRRRRAFTLIELLVVITIIAILASVFLGAMYSAQETARTAKTKATIAKINSLIMQRYESYANRRVPVVVPPGTPRTEAAYFRLFALRELMRMEMPDRLTDVLDGPTNPIPSPYTTLTIPGIPRTSISQAYQRRLAVATAAKPIGNPTVDPTKFAYKNQGAECLYMIVMYGLGEEESPRENFRDNEIRDTDSNGLFEFVDGWDRPINFLRWAPGFQSDFQGQMGIVDSAGGSNSLVAKEGLAKSKSLYERRYLTFISGTLAGQQFRINTGGYDPSSRTFMVSPDFPMSPSASDRFIITALPPEQDPFDPFRVYPGTCALMPLIYSAGPDGIYDIYATRDYDAGGAVLQYASYRNDPFLTYDPSKLIVVAVGAPIDRNSDVPGPPDGEDNWFDNIHNHLTGTR
jgi:prepilin-type N-terminal cleavage/methylation domain-containing protein